MYWTNSHTKNTSKVFRKKRTQNTLDLIAGLSILGPRTTNDIAKFTLRNRLNGNSKIPYKETQTVQGIYYNLIRDRPRTYQSGKMSGLVSDGYIKQVGTKINEKNKTVPLYFLTQRGHFFSIGFNFGKTYFESFLKNASKNSLFFAYIYSIYKQTSHTFVNDIFIQPIYHVIRNEKLNLDEEFNFYFASIAQFIGNSIYEKFEKILIKSLDDPKSYLKKQNFEILIENTFYVDTFSTEWIESLIEHYYSENSDQDFYRKYQDDSDSQLLFVVFRAVYFAYYSAGGFGVPKPKNKLPLPKWLKEHRRRKNKAKKQKFRVSF